MSKRTLRMALRLAPMLLIAASLAGRLQPARAEQPLHVAILGDISNFDPQSFLAVNFPVIKNLYDSLLEYTPEGKAVPSLATGWDIAPDATSVTVTLRPDVLFANGDKLDAQAVAETLKKAADPQRGKNVFATMSFVKDWTVIDEHTIRLNFKGPSPVQQITDLLQFVSVIDPAGMDAVETKPAGSGAYMLADRAPGQRIHLVANPHYWRTGQPVSRDVTITVFSDDQSATAALESGAVDMVYGGSARSGVRLHRDGYGLLQGPGPLVQALRLNPNRGPFRNAKFRQAFNYLVDRASMLRLGYAGLGQVEVLPWAPASPAYDPSYTTRYAFDLDKGKALLAQTGLSAAEMNDWTLLVNSGDEPLVVLSQILQGTLAKVGITVNLQMRQGADFVDSMLGGKFDAMFSAVGNVQKFPSRLATNSIYRTANNTILGSPNPFPDYVAAIDRVSTAAGPNADLKGAFDNLNQVLIADSFCIPTNSYDPALLLTAKAVSGLTADIDDMLVLRTVGFTH